MRADARRARGRLPGSCTGRRQAREARKRPPPACDLAQTGTAIVGVSVLEDLAEIKTACRDKLTVLGNLNGIEMCRWTPAQAQTMVKDALAKAGPGGGFILSDNHGEIPWQVSDDILQTISETVHQWGRYPLKYVRSDER